jgi:precorrin-2 dehydrogenase/sirohydrochlorin ferrochelatase
MIDLQPSSGHALVVGGGMVAARKVRALVEAEFQITVVAPSVSNEIRTAPFVTLIEREFERGDFDAEVPFAVVFACTDVREVNRSIWELARSVRIPVVVADAQSESTFFTPATLRDGELAIAISTGGASPTLARTIREKIAAALGPGWGQIVLVARGEREKRLGRRTEILEQDDE